MGLSNSLIAFSVYPILKISCFPSGKFVVLDSAGLTVLPDAITDFELFKVYGEEIQISS